MYLCLYTNCLISNLSCKQISNVDDILLNNIMKYNYNVLIMEAKGKMKVKLYNTTTTRKLQKEEGNVRRRWRSEPREGGGWADADSLEGVVQYATAAEEEDRGQRAREAREQE